MPLEKDKHPLHVPSGFVVEGFIEDDSPLLYVLSEYFASAQCTGRWRVAARRRCKQGASVPTVPCRWALLPFPSAMHHPPSFG
eukprot:4581296-Amphidinium_carterae.3